MIFNIEEKKQEENVTVVKCHDHLLEVPYESKGYS